MNETRGGGHHETHGAPGGLASTADGLTLETGWIAAGNGEGRSGTLEFRILGRDGEPVRTFDEQHGRTMHLMVVRRDLAHYRHLHPSMGADGTWSAPLTFPEGGVYRVFADFAAAGRGLTLGDDLEVPGTYEPAPLPAPGDVARTNGFEVGLDAVVHAGGDASLAFDVSRNGRPVEDLEPYLGALGHLGALREGDLAFLHVHPESEGGSGPRIAFRAAFPSGGSYRLFLQFAHGGEVPQEAEIEELRSIKEEEFGTSEIPQGMNQGEMEAMGMAEPSELANKDPFDKAFIDAMIPHHESAIDMANVALENTDNPEIREIAEGIVDAQEREIAQMEEWRREWYPES